MNKIGIFLLLIVSISFSNCSDFTDEARQGMQDKLLGTWTLVSFSDLSGSSTPSSTHIVEFSADYSYIITSDGVSTFLGEYYIDYDEINFNYRGTILKFTDTEMVLFAEDFDRTYFYEK
jgi:hypothetical protein